MKRLFLAWFRTMVTVIVVSTMAVMIFSLRDQLNDAKRRLAAMQISPSAENDDGKGVWVLCRFDLKDDADIGAYKNKTLEVVPKVLGEPGCRIYTLLEDAHTDWDKPERFGERTMWMLEKWDSVDALKAHLETPHMKEFGPVAKEMRRAGTFHVLQEVKRRD
jgi:quinol monooxygenase YgiN